jgi:hypothetical protein
MVAYNFSAQFANDVEVGLKAQTIRREGKRNPPEVGDELQLYTGMRTKHCRLLRNSICSKVTPIKILPKFGEIHIQASTRIHWLIFDSDKSLNALARHDGFHSYKELFDYFESQVDDNGVFKGHLIEWTV